MSFEIPFLDLIPDGMNKKEEIVTDYVKKQKYNEALTRMNNKRGFKTNHARFFFLLKCICLFNTNQLDLLLETVERYHPFREKDEIDMRILSLLSNLYHQCGYHSMSKRLELLSASFFSVEGSTSSKLNSNDNSLSCYSQYCGHHDDVNIIIDVIKSCYRNSLFTEMAFFVAQLKLMKQQPDNELLHILKLYPQVDSFSCDILYDHVPILLDAKMRDGQEELFDALCIVINKLERKLILFDELTGIVDKYVEGKNCYYLLEKRSSIQDLLSNSNSFSRACEMYYSHYEELGIDYTECVLVGNYFSAMKLKFGYDFSSWTEIAPTVDFSIVIPVKNDNVYLPYAIKTCLNQDYSGSFEILISDNSDDSYSVLDCLGAFNDERIRYIRPPKHLPLAKSFEFAYLSARGKYLLSIGSDDAILPYSLSKLSFYFNQYPDNDVISWENARYEWASEINHDRPNSTIKYRKEEKYTIVSDELLEYYYKRQVDFGYLPKLYLGTCFKRNLINKILHLSGKFEDGISQDIYMAVLTARIVGSYLRLGYPIAISGVSPSSTGYKDRKKPVGIQDINKTNERQFENFRFLNRYSKMQSTIKYYIMWAGFDFFELVESARAEYWLGTELSVDVAKSFYDSSFSIAKHIDHCDIDLLNEQYKANFRSLFANEEKFQKLIIKDGEGFISGYKRLLAIVVLRYLPKVYQYHHQKQLKKTGNAPYYHSALIYDSGKTKKLRDISSASEYVHEVLLEKGIINES